MEYVSQSMKSSFKSLAALITAILVINTAWAGDSDNENRTTEKARQDVEEAAPDDWHTLANAADKCIKKKVNLTEAKEWLERSIEIREAPYNLSVMGDYYLQNQIPEQALEYYVKSLRVGLQQDITHRDEVTHAKMMSVRKQLLKRIHS